MKLKTDALKRLLHWNGRVLLFLGFAAGVVVLLLWLAGKFSPKVATEAQAAGWRPLPAGAKTFEARTISRPRIESAVGTVQAVHEASVGSRIMALVETIDPKAVKAGAEVREGQVLMQLDDSGVRSKLRQAEAAVTAAEAVRAQAASDVEKYKPLAATGAISQQKYDQTVTALRTAEANVQGARDAVKEVEAMLSYATIRAPMDAVVIDKKVNVGDMVTPGQVLVTLFNPQRMQLVASVPESLAGKLEEGHNIGVKISSLHKQCMGTISEIVPEAQPASRTFQVKVTGPCPPGIRPGVFGRILIPVGTEDILVVPQAALRNVGQLELVEVAKDGHMTQRSVRTGRRLGDVPIPDAVEVLSGLDAGEYVVLPPAAAAPQEAAHG